MRGASGGQLSRRRAWRATVRAMESKGPEPDVHSVANLQPDVEPHPGMDTLTISLLVFFVSLILIVVSLLVLPLVVPGFAAA